MYRSGLFYIIHKPQNARQTPCSLQPQIITKPHNARQTPCSLQPQIIIITKPHNARQTPCSLQPQIIIITKPQNARQTPCSLQLQIMPYISFYIYFGQIQVRSREFYISSTEFCRRDVV